MGRFSHFDGSFSFSLAGTSRLCRAERGKREEVQRSCSFRIARREDNSMLVCRLGVRRGARAKSFPHFPVAPTTFFDEKRVAACYTRISEFCSSLIRFPVCMRSVCSRTRVSCFSFFSFTSSRVCNKTLWDSSFGVKVFVNVLHGVLSSPIMHKKSVNCEVKVKTKIENSLCARYT